MKAEFHVKNNTIYSIENQYKYYIQYIKGEKYE